jgi:hypothetical protein
VLHWDSFSTLRVWADQIGNLAGLDRSLINPLQALIADVPVMIAIRCRWVRIGFVRPQCHFVEADSTFDHSEVVDKTRNATGGRTRLDLCTLVVLVHHM